MDSNNVLQQLVWIVKQTYKDYYEGEIQPLTEYTLVSIVDFGMNDSFTFREHQVVLCKDGDNPNRSLKDSFTTKIGKDNTNYLVHTNLANIESDGVFGFYNNYGYSLYAPEFSEKVKRDFFKYYSNNVRIYVPTVVENTSIPDTPVTETDYNRLLSERNIVYTPLELPYGVKSVLESCVAPQKPHQQRDYNDPTVLEQVYRNTEMTIQKRNEEINNIFQKKEPSTTPPLTQNVQLLSLSDRPATVSHTVYNGSLPQCCLRPGDTIELSAERYRRGMFELEKTQREVERKRIDRETKGELLVMQGML